MKTMEVHSKSCRVFHGKRWRLDIPKADRCTRCKAERKAKGKSWCRNCINETARDLRRRKRRARIREIANKVRAA